MFVESSAVVPLRFEATRDAFEAAVADDGFAAEAQRAFDHGMACLGRGTHPSHSLDAPLRVRVSAIRRFARDILVELYWEPTGPARRFFPNLAADFALAKRNHDDTGISMVACCRLPLAATNRDYDHSLVSRAVQETLDAFLTEVVIRLLAINASNAEDAVSNTRLTRVGDKAHD